MPRFTHLLLALALLTAAAVTHAGPPDFAPAGPPAAVPVGSSFGLGIAGAISGSHGPSGSVGQVPEPEMWLFTLTGLLGAFLLRRRRR